MQTILLICLFAAVPTEIQARVIKVTDGDTIWVVSNGERIKIRIQGIDAPEFDQPHGTESTAELSRLVADRDVTIQLSGKKHRKREVAVILVEGRDIRSDLLQSGTVWHEKRYNHDPDFASLEIDAHESKRGLWASDNPIEPRNWRANKKGGLKQNARSPVRH